MSARHSVLPKALRRGGKRPLELVWPVTEHRVHRGHSKRHWAFLQRSVYQHWLRLGRQAARAAKAAAK